MADAAPPANAVGRLRRLAEELVELQLDTSGTLGTSGAWEPDELLLAELDYALRPTVFERRTPSYGSIVAPTAEPAAWFAATTLDVTWRPVDGFPLADTRRFADGISSWIVRSGGDAHDLVVFDRPAGSERDLVVLAGATGATIVQRHPVGWVRAAGRFGVIRWDGIAWHHEPPLANWIASLADDACNIGIAGTEHDALVRLLEFAVHDLGSRGIGALLVYRPDLSEPATLELRLPVPPPLQIRRPSDLAPLRHAIAQIDGAGIFDGGGTLRQLGVRLVPSPLAEADVEGYRGMRHTSARRYSFDDPQATVIVVSEDGPVTVLRGGELVGRSGLAPPA